MDKNLDKFEAEFEVIKNKIHKDTNGEIELYYDWLDADDVVIGVQRTTEPINFKIDGWDEENTMCGWTNDTINDFCDEIRYLSNLLERELGEEWVAGNFDLDSWYTEDCWDSDEWIYDKVGHRFNICRAVTCQVYR